MSSTIKATELIQNATTDMSLIGLILNADLVVKLVILILLISSIWIWAIIFTKYFHLKALINQSVRFEKLFWSGQLLDQLYEKIKGRTDHSLANIFVAAMDEWRLTATNKNILSISGLKDRINKTVNLVINREINKLDSNLNILALVSSNAPFVGLFGTVWGIMHSFQSIAATKSTSLAVVAPGIAEALLATAIGLVAAIPAAMFYNILNTKINEINNKMEDFASELTTLLWRELDERQINGS